jgi:hypothetical protein
MAMLSNAKAIRTQMVVDLDSFMVPSLAGDVSRRAGEVSSRLELGEAGLASDGLEPEAQSTGGPR